MKVEIIKPRGRGGVLALWIILFWPIAIIYFFTRRWTD